MTLIDTSFLVAAVIAAFLVGPAKGGLPAIGALGGPVPAIAIQPAAALLLPIFVVTDKLGLWVYRREFNFRFVSILVPAAAFGIAFGWATASCMSESL